MAKYEPTSTERQLFEENDALRLKLVSKDQTIARLKAEIDQLELKDRAKEKRMGDLHDRIYELGVANRDLETEVRNLKFDKEHLLERLADKQQHIIDRYQLTGPGDVLGGALERATRRMK